MTTASLTAITLDEVLSLMGALNPSQFAVASFAMNSATYIALLKLKASTGGNYMAEAESDAEGYPLLFGKRVYLSPSFPVIAALAKAIAFGDLTQLYRREVIGGLTLRAFPERFAEFGQTAFELYWRVQFGLAVGTASPLPVRLLQMHS